MLSIKKKLLLPSATVYSLFPDKPVKALIKVQKAKIKTSQRIKLCNIKSVCIRIFFCKSKGKEASSKLLKAESPRLNAESSRMNAQVVRKKEQHGLKNRRRYRLK